MSEDIQSITQLVSYMKKLENEMRDIRQRLEKIERNITLNNYTTSQAKIQSHVEEIKPTVKELVKKIESYGLDQTNPISILSEHEISNQIIELKSLLTQLGY